MSITFSIRKCVLGGSMGASLLAVGCTPKEIELVHTPGMVADQPAADEATVVRGYPKSHARYESGATQAWPTRFYYEPDPKMPEAFNIPADSIMFLLQGGSLPATMIMEPPFQTAVVYGSDVLIPSYTAMPPRPPESIPVVGRADPDPLSAPQRPVAPALEPILPEEPPTILPPAPPKPKLAPAGKQRSTPTTWPADH